MLAFLLLALLAVAFVIIARRNWTYIAYLGWRFSREPKAILEKYKAKNFAELLDIKGVFWSEAELFAGYGNVFVDHPECRGGFLSDVVTVSVKAIPAEKINIGHCGSYSLARGFFYTLFFGADPICGEKMHPNVPPWKIEGRRICLFVKLLFCVLFKRPLRGYMEIPEGGKILDGVFASKFFKTTVIVVCDNETAEIFRTESGSRLIPVKISFA